MQRILVKDADNIRLDKYLMAQFPFIGFGRWNRAVRENKIKVNGKKQPLSFRLKAGDEIKIFLPDEVFGENIQEQHYPFLKARREVSILYEDTNLVICNKPAGLPVYGDQTDTLLYRVQKYLFEKGEYTGQDFAPCLCHRLDTGTSGLVILAKNKETEEYITKLIAEHKIKKEYLCITYGIPEKKQAVLKAYHYKNAKEGKVFVSHTFKTGCKPIETHYQILHIQENLALLKVALITGRTHQIRAHMASIGYPLLGDSKYGNQQINRKYRFKYQALCAWKLTFPKIEDTIFANLSNKTFEAEKPWYCNQILENSLLAKK